MNGCDVLYNKYIINRAVNSQVCTQMLIKFIHSSFTAKRVSSQKLMFEYSFANQPKVDPNNDAYTNS